MIKKWLKLILTAILVIHVCGCAELRRKFVRKNKSKKEELSFYRVEEYKPKPPRERYQEHYVLWHNWHLDLQRTEGTSHLRDIRAGNEALRHLTAMRDLLQEEKAQELDLHIKDIESVLARIKQRKRDVMKDTRSRRVLEKAERVIINNFSYNRMKEHIVTSDEVAATAAE